MDTVSLAILNLVLRDITLDTREVNEILFQAAKEDTFGGLLYNDHQGVSSNFRGEGVACIVEAIETMTLVDEQNKLSNLKVLGWYDNEWGFMVRMVALFVRIAEDFF
jgi:glyceraldehyde 3-phosphate dehydrogenase